MYPYITHKKYEANPIIISGKKNIIPNHKKTDVDCMKSQLEMKHSGLNFG